MISAVDYPANLPCVSANGFSMLIRSGIVRDTEGYAIREQRRRFTHLPTLINVAFIMNSSEENAWFKWIDANGFSWFNIELPHPFMPAGALKEKTPVRVASAEIPFEYRQHNTSLTSLLLELAPSVYANSAFENGYVKGGRWPTYMPVVNGSPLEYSADSGLVETVFSAGNRKLRRIYKHMPEVFNYSVNVHTAEFLRFMAFAQIEGFEGFDVPIHSQKSTNSDIVPFRKVRIISDINVISRGWNWYDIEFDVEAID